MSNLDFAYVLIGFIIGIIPAIISKVMKKEWLGLIASSSCILLAINCHERIKAKATTCRYCSREIT